MAGNMTKKAMQIARRKRESDQAEDAAIDEVTEELPEQEEEVTVEEFPEEEEFPGEDFEPEV